MTRNREKEIQDLGFQALLALRRVRGLALTGEIEPTVMQTYAIAILNEISRTILSKNISKAGIEEKKEKISTVHPGEIISRYRAMNGVAFYLGVSRSQLAKLSQIKTEGVSMIVSPLSSGPLGFCLQTTRDILPLTVAAVSLDYKNVIIPQIPNGTSVLLYDDVFGNSTVALARELKIRGITISSQIDFFGLYSI